MQGKKDACQRCNSQVNRPEKPLSYMVLVSQILWLLLQVMFYITFTNQRHAINW